MFGLRGRIALVGGALVAACLAVASPPALASGGTVPTVTITPSANPAVVGTINYSVAVTDPSGAGIPSGSVLMWDGTNTCLISPLVSGSGSCSLYETPSTYNITATYSGDANYTPAFATVSEVVNAATPTVVVTPQPGATTGSVSYGVIVTGVSGVPVPTGSVSVSDGVNPACSVLTLDDSGSGSCSIDEGAGTYGITASYSGDSNYSTASGTASEMVAQATATVLPAGTTGAVTGEVTYSVSVTGTVATIVPGGTVVVSAVDSIPGSCTISLTAGTGAEAGSAVGSCQIFQQPGRYTMQFSYSGDGNYLPPASAPTISQFVNYAPASVTVTPSANPATALGSGGTATVTYTVTVTGSSSLPDPTGTVDVTDGTGGSCFISSLTGGSAGTSSGDCSIKEAVGSYTVTATTSGDTYYPRTTGQVTEYVATKTATAYSKTGSPVAPGGTVTLTAVVSSKVPGGGTPSGTVVFAIDGLNQPPVPLIGGVATLAYQVPADAHAGEENVVVDFLSSDTNAWFDSVGHGGFRVS